MRQNHHRHSLIWPVSLWNVPSLPTSCGLALTGALVGIAALPDIRCHGSQDSVELLTVQIAVSGAFTNALVWVVEHSQLEPGPRPGWVGEG